MQSKTILIAGGTGLVGTKLVSFLQSQNFEVRILSRQNTDISKSIYHWDPSKREIDDKALENVEVIINLVGAGVADKRWTKKRKQEIITSRIEPAQFLRTQVHKMPSLKQYISASGISCYDYDNRDKVYAESDAYADDFLSQVVKSWEQAADMFQDVCAVSKVRISVVLTTKGGALPKLEKPVKMFVGSPIGSGKQWMPWIHIHDLCRLFAHLIEFKSSGAYNALAGVESNKNFVKTLAATLKKPLWLPRVPSFLIRILFGEMSVVVLEGVNASNKKIKSTGFNFNYDSLDSALQNLYSSDSED